jgi:hypothetical protein
MNLFVVINQKTGGVWAFTNHIDALAQKRAQPPHQSKSVNLVGVAVDCEANCAKIKYVDALPRRPKGACYCDLDDKACFEAGHWASVKPQGLNNEQS